MSLSAAPQIIPMSATHHQATRTLESFIGKISYGTEFWLARDLQEMLGYVR
jgi:hypothetical protein